MPPPQRAALILRDVMGFSAAEVSGQLGTSVAAAFIVMDDPGRAGFFARFGLPAELP
jgi:hypothetical protein